MSRWIVLTDSSPSPAPELANCLRTPSGRTALRWIEDQRLPIRGLILSPDSWDEDFSCLVSRCRQLRPGTPIHTLAAQHSQDLATIDDPLIKQRLGLGRSIKIEELPSFLQSKTRLESAGRNSREPLIHEGPFVGIPLSDFQDCESLLFDLHLKLSSGKFIRLLDAREAQPWGRILKYRERGVTHLYIAREAYERSLTAIRLFQETIPESLSSGDSAWSEIQIAHSLRAISGLMSDQRSLEQIDSNVWEKCHELLYFFGRALAERKIEQDSNQLQRWLRRSLFLDHSLSVFLISILIGRPLQFTSEENLLALGSAALFHDISLLDFERIPEQEKPEGLVGKTLEKFLTHPDDSARFLEERLGAPAIVIQAVQHHHWRYDGSGILRQGKRNPVFVPRMAEIIGLAEECSHALIRQPNLSLQEITASLSQEMSSKFSPEVLSGMRACFTPSV
ncbi:MAG: HD domain-containing protein [Bdellovibrionales bacterium]|nr:HD domain-containing protein [Bdellovibrionales bacterium]